AIRNIEQGGVKIDGAKVSNRALRIAPGTYVVQVGKRKWARVTVR
ncbi:MAG: tyrosine--tRNA ligase, partial [Archangium gephyra]